MGRSRVKRDWYRTIFDSGTAALPWASGAARDVDRALAMLQATGTERVLDLACGTGRHAIELARRGFSVVGVDLSAPLIELGAQEAAARHLDVEFIESDLRDLEFEAEFDLVLSLNDGAIGYFETDEENLRTFEVISRALRPGGGHLMQVPNVLFIQKHSPHRTWVAGPSCVELLEYRWSDKGRHLYGASRAIPYGERLEQKDPVRFRQRLYSVEELRPLLESVDLDLVEVFRGNGRSCPPDDTQYEVFVRSRKRGGR